MQSSEKPLSQIIDICRRKEGAFDSLSSQQNKVLNQIDICRTETAGIFVYKCENDSCGYNDIQYKSCKNRACSVCSTLPREKWKLQRENDLIPNTPYYHNVFTIPHSFSQIASQNQKVFQTLLLKAVEQTLKAFEEEYCRGGHIGFMLVLHTWSTRLLNHYHIHAAIPGGYLLDDVWYPLNKYLFPARALATMFRKKLCSGLRSLNRKSKLKFYGELAPLNDPSVFSEVIDKGYKKKWYVHSEVTKGNDPAKIMGYLANYVYKTAIDHKRIQTINENEVTFTYRSHEENDRGAWKSLALKPEEFLRRFSSHIQPSRFVRIRYYGIMGGGVKKRNLSLIFEQLKSEYVAINQKIHRSSCEDIKEMSGRMTAYLCPCCNSKMLSPWAVYKRNAGLDPPIDCEIQVRTEQLNKKVCA